MRTALTLRLLLRFVAGFPFVAAGLALPAPAFQGDSQIHEHAAVGDALIQILVRNVKRLALWAAWLFEVADVLNIKLFGDFLAEHLSCGGSFGPIHAKLDTPERIGS